jgi:glycosyltransferase involved in cell wall biosynthesis
MRREKSLWFVSEAYYPDEVGTAYYVTKLAEGLAASFNVRVLCGFPIYDARGAKVPSEEIHGHVRIKRCRGATLDKDRLFLRIVNLATISLSLFFLALTRFRKNDVVLVVTSPPLLPFTIKTACALKRAKCILRIDDVYPEALIAAGMLNPRSSSAAFMRSLNKWLYRRVDAIVVMGRDMERLARQLAAPTIKNISIIPNWADVDEIFPVPKSQNALLKELGLSEKFVVLCAGNMGRAQAIEMMFSAAELMKGTKGLHFLFIGSGAKRAWMDREAKETPLENVTILNQRPRSDQNNFLNACDINLVSLVSGMTGAGVPSRLYNIMAAGKPVIAVAPEDSEACRVVLEEDIGWVVSPDRPDRLAEAIAAAASNPARLADMGVRARSAARGKYSPATVLNKYRELIGSLHA